MINESGVKISYLLTLIYPPCIGFLQYININDEAFTILGIMLIIDFIVGTAKSYIIKEAITYRRAVAGIISKTIILIIPLVLALVFVAIADIHKFNADDYLMYVVSALVVAEALSIVENFYIMRTKNNPSEIDFVSFVIRAIRTFLEKLLQGFKI